mmetsp:Transcript_42993/g.115907  ORF Transcript_42993/g.115907 Transcript_42993/m.115907 type:complete len:239 (-) Transcript_42993:690-1406(-)
MHTCMLLEFGIHRPSLHGTARASTAPATDLSDECPRQEVSADARPRATLRPGLMPCGLLCINKWQLTNAFYEAFDDLLKLGLARHLVVSDACDGPAHLHSAGAGIAIGAQGVDTDGQAVQELHTQGLPLKVEGPDAFARVEVHPERPHGECCRILQYAGIDLIGAQARAHDLVTDLRDRPPYLHASLLCVAVEIEALDPNRFVLREGQAKRPALEVEYAILARGRVAEVHAQAFGLLR